MDIEFKRNRVQEYLEKEIDPTYFPTSNDDIVKTFRTKAEGHQLSEVECFEISRLIKEDAHDYLYSATVSFFTAIENIYYKNFSWATVELYYVVYYLMRVKLHLAHIALFRAKGFYYFFNRPAESIKRVEKNNTHEGTIALFMKLFKEDLILNNTVDGENSIKWIKNNREIVNYRSVEFKDPNNFLCFNKFNSSDLLIRNIELIIMDVENIYSFQPEFAMLGIPLIFFKEIIKENTLDLKHIFEDYKKAFIEDKIQKLNVGFIKDYLSL